MTITTVNEAIEALQRFNPNARVEPEIEIDGVSPATECCIDSGESELVKELRVQIDGLEEMEQEYDDLVKFKNEVERIVLDSRIEASQAVALIQANLDEMSES